MGRITCTNLVCRRGAFELAIPELTIGSGEKIALLGENGCGKTTLLQVLTGLLPLNAGSIDFAGRRWDKLHPAHRAEHMSYLPQESGVLFNLTVAELLRLTLHESGLLTGGARDAVVAATEMGDYLARVYHTLSGGEKRRAMLLRILCRDTAFTLLDEPTAPLDMRHGVQVMRYLGGVPRAVVAAMHDINLAVRYFERFLLMKNGRIVFDVSKTELTAAMLSEIYGLKLNARDGYFLPEL